MKKTLSSVAYLFAAFVFLLLPACQEEPLVDDGTYWAKTYGTTKNDQARDCVLTQDGGMVIAGVLSGYWGEEYNSYTSLTKLDLDGQIQWYKTMNTGASSFSMGIVENKNGDLLMHKQNINGNFLYLLSEDGAVKKQKKCSDTFLQLTGTADGGYIGISYRDIVKLDANLDLQWTTTLDHESSSGYMVTAVKNIYQTTDGGFMGVGFRRDLDECTMTFIVKLDALGNIVWSRTYGDNAKKFLFGLDSSLSEAIYDITGLDHVDTDEEKILYALTENEDGSFIVSGTSLDIKYYYPELLPSPDVIIFTQLAAFIEKRTTTDTLAMKIDASGELMWAYTYTETDWFNHSDVCMTNGVHMVATEDGGVTIMGDGHNNSYPYINPEMCTIEDDWIFLLSLDAQGEIVWKKTYNDGLDASDLIDQDDTNTYRLSELGNSLHKLDDLGYLITGRTNSFHRDRKQNGTHEMLLLKTDEEGRIPGTKLEVKNAELYRMVFEPQVIYRDDVTIIPSDFEITDTSTECTFIDTGEMLIAEEM